MKDLSFRKKLLISFLLIGIVPLLVCALLMLNIFRATLTRNVTETAQTQLERTGEDMDELFRAGQGVLLSLREDPQVLTALDGTGPAAAQSIYYTLFDAAGSLLSDANFALFDSGGQRLYSTSSRSGGVSLPTDWGVLKAAGDAQDVVYRAAGGDSLLRAACAVRSGEQVLGYVMMDLTERHFERLLEGKYSATSDLMVLDPYWYPVYSSHSVRADELVPRLRTQLLAGQTLSDSGGEYSYYILQDSTTGFFLLLQQPQPLSGWIMRLLYLVTLVSIALCVALSAAVAMGLTRQLFEPIRALNSAMAQVEQGNLEARIESERTDEMGQLAGRFNRMAERLKSNLEESMRQQKELGEAQVRMMQAQLNPHFLYNTLDTVKWLGKINQVPEVATISADLADILRSSISSDEFVVLEQELRLLDRYVEIQKIRFSGQFRLHIQVEDGLLDVLVPKLMLQPLVENAIVHGFEDCDSGQITVSAQEQGGLLVVMVRDNGRGLSEESLRNFQAEILPGPGRHLGLHNVDAILRLHYGPDYGLRFVPVAGPGACVCITLPITRKGGESPC